MNTGKLLWLQAGHEAFARYGPEAIKVDKLAKALNKSRSGFYYNFADQEDYVEQLLQYHIEQARVMKLESDEIDRFVPDYLEWIIKHKNHLFFSKNLFLNSATNPAFKKTWETVSSIAEDKTAELWIKMLGLENAPKSKTAPLYETMRSSALTRLDYDSLNLENLTAVINDVNRSLKFMLE